MQIKNIVHGEKYEHQGQEKTSWQTVGKLFIKDDGKMFIKLSAIPTNFDGMLQVFDQREKGGNNQGGYQAQQKEEYRSNQSQMTIDDSEVPF